jgi:hypothetical protein
MNAVIISATLNTQIKAYKNGIPFIKLKMNWLGAVTQTCNPRYFRRRLGRLNFETIPGKKFTRPHLN